MRLTFATVALGFPLLLAVGAGPQSTDPPATTYLARRRNCRRRESGRAARHQLPDRDRVEARRNATGARQKSVSFSLPAVSTTRNGCTCCRMATCWWQSRARKRSAERFRRRCSKASRARVYWASRRTGKRCCVTPTATAGRSCAETFAADLRICRLVCGFAATICTWPTRTPCCASAIAPATGTYRGRARRFSICRPGATTTTGRATSSPTPTGRRSTCRSVRRRTSMRRSSTQKSPVEPRFWRRTPCSWMRVFATGLRNPNGMDWAPGTTTLWTVVNERDLLGDDLVPDYLTQGARRCVLRLAVFLLWSARRSATQGCASGSGSQSDRARPPTRPAYRVTGVAFLQRPCVSGNVARSIHRAAWIMEPLVVLRLQGDSCPVSERTSVGTATGFPHRVHCINHHRPWTARGRDGVIRRLPARGR